MFQSQEAINMFPNTGCMRLVFVSWMSVASFLQFGFIFSSPFPRFISQTSDWLELIVGVSFLLLLH